MVNYHIHTSFCDGLGDPEEYVLEAINRGLKAIGFSSHSPLPFSNDWSLQDQQIHEYFTVIEKLKEKYQGLIQIYMGMEVDYLSKSLVDGSAKFEELNLDYTIGSVHFGSKRAASGDYLTLHSSEEDFISILNYCFDGDIKKFVASYYQNVRDMVATVKPNIVGHLDLIKKFNQDDKYFSEAEEWYRTEVLNTLEVIAEHKAILEVNTSGLFKGEIQGFYPGIWILEEARKLNIPAQISSDAHHPQAVDAKFLEASKALQEAGYTAQRVLLDHTWKSKGLSDEN